MRARNSAKTRTALLASARRLFAAGSYEQVGLREIGEAARADPALIARYFGGKEGLFAEVLASSGGLGPFLAGDRTEFGARVGRALVFGDGGSGGLEGLMVALRSLSDPNAPDRLRPFVEQLFVEPLAEWLGGPERLVRARLILAYLAGVALTRPAGASHDDSEGKRSLAHRFATGLQLLVGEGLAHDEA